MTTTPRDDLDQRVPDELPLLRALVDEWVGGGKPL